MSSRALTAAMCTVPAMEMSDRCEVTRTRSPAAVRVTVDDAELAPTLIAMGVPQRAGAPPPLPAPESPAAPAAAPAVSGFTTSGPDPIGRQLAAAVSRGRRG